MDSLCALIELIRDELHMRDNGIAEALTVRVLLMTPSLHT